MWQEIEGRWHVCHWWQHLAGSMITAMTLLILLPLAVAAALAIALVLHGLSTIVKGDGYGRRSGRRTPPLSHVPDQFDPRSRMA
jgi:hypothetical protein